MQFTRPRIVLAVLLLAAAGAGGFAYYKYRSFTAYLTGQLGGQLGNKLGREVRFTRVSFSPLKGIVIREACVSRLPDFSKGNFFCAQKTVIRPRFSSLFKKTLYFSSITFDKPVIKLREKNGKWDFEDLLALLPDTEKGLHLTWNTSELNLEDAKIEADMETSGLSLALDGMDIRLDHHSSYGGNYSLEAEGGVKTLHRGKLVSAGAELDADLNFDYGGLASTNGRLKVRSLTYGAVSLEKFETDWKFFNMRKPLPERNYSASVSAKALLVPAQAGGARDRVAEALGLFSKAMGKPAPRIEDIEMSSFGAAFTLDDSVLSLKDIRLRANFINLDAALSIYGPAGKADASLTAEIGDNELSMSAAGPISNPKIKPLLSDTLSAKFRQALTGAEDALLKLFPVTGDTP
jgi:hypothetical protein